MMRFIIADDHSIVRMGLRLMLENDFPDVLIDEVDNGTDLIEKIKSAQYDLLILDFQMPNTDTFHVIENLLARAPLLNILMYSMALEKVYAAKLFKAGVRGFLSKEAPNTELVKAVSTVLRGDLFATDLNYLNEQDEQENASNPFSSLSNKEMDILAYLIQGKSTKDMSSLLNLQWSTVSTHKARIFKKLKVETVVELVALAKEYGVG